MYQVYDMDDIGTVSYACEWLRVVDGHCDDGYARQHVHVEAERGRCHCAARIHLKARDREGRHNLWVVTRTSIANR